VELTPRVDPAPPRPSGRSPRRWVAGAIVGLVVVVLEGSWDPSGAFFASDHILVKHDESYESEDEYQERMSEADEGASG